MTNPISDSIDINIRDILERIWRARRKIVLFQLATILATVFVILFWPRTYASEAKLYLQKGRESVGLDPTATTGKTIALQQAGRDAEIKSAVDVLMSRGIIEPTVEQLEPDVVLGHESVGEGKSTFIGDTIKKAIGSVVGIVRSIDPASDRERAIVQIEKNLVVDAERKSEIISIVYEAETPELAQRVVNGIVEQYKIKHSTLYRTSGSTDFFDEQSQRLREELLVASNALRDAKNEIGIASIPEQSRIIEDRLGRTRQNIMDVDKSIQSGVARAKNLATQMKEQPKRTGTNEVTKANAPDDLQAQAFYQLKLRLMDAEATYTPRHPQVRLLKEQVNEAQRELTKNQSNRVETTAAINPVHERLTMSFTDNTASLAGELASKKKLLTQEKELLAEIRNLNKHTMLIEQLVRDVNVAETKYVMYAGNLEEARIDQAMQKDSLSSVNVAQAATLQEKPVAPSKPLVAICGMLLAFAGSLAIAFLSVQFDDRITSQYAARKGLGVPVLGVLPQSRNHSRVLA